MTFLSRKTTVIKGDKELPKSTLLIITRNNQEELKHFLHFLKSVLLFQGSSGQIIIIDQFSFDHTIETIREFQRFFLNEIIVLKKNDTIHISQLVHPYLSNQMVQVINLATIENDNRYYPSYQLPRWYSKLLEVFSKKKKYMDVKKIIEQMEQERSRVYEWMERRVIEQLTNLQMILKEDNDDPTTTEYLQKITTKLKNVMQHFDPSIYMQEDTLYSNITGFIKDFTNRTQVEFTVKANGKEKKLDHVLGITIMRMFKQIFDFIESQAHCSKVTLKLSWKQNSLWIHLKGLNEKIDKKNINQGDLKGIEERLMLLDGKMKFNVKNNEGFTILLVLPLHGYLYNDAMQKNTSK